MFRWKRNVFNRIFNVALGLFISGTIKLRQLKSNLGEMTVRADGELDCDFVGHCRWFSEPSQGEGGGRLAPWNVAQGTPDPIVWFAATATNRQPQSPFGYLALAKGKGEALTSAILPCQKGAGLLTFEYWLSSSASAYVCVLAAETRQQIHCSHPLQRSPGHATIKILGPILKPFKLAIIGTGQGFIIVDNIRYSGEVAGECPDPSLLALLPNDGALEETETGESPTTSTPGVAEDDDEAVESKSLALLGGGVGAWPLADKRNHTFIQSSDDLTCDFTESQFPCRWGPALPGGWAVADGEADEELLSVVLGTDTPPAFPAAMLRKPSTRIVSDPIVCQKQDAQVTLSWWGSGNATLRVCAVSFPQSVEIVCGREVRPNEGDYPGPFIFEFKGNIFGPFVWEISVSWPSGEDFVGLIDDVAYFAEICAISPYFSVRPPVEEGEAVTTQPLVVFKETQEEEEWGEPLTVPPTDPPTEPPTTTAPTTTTPTTTTTQPTTTLATTRRSRPLFTSRWRPPHLRRFRLTTAAPTLPPNVPDACDLLDCDFNQDTCKWSGVGIGSSHWRRLKQPFGTPLSRLTDIRVTKSSGGFLAAQLHPQHNRLALVASPRLPEGGIKIFQFRFYRASRGVTLKLCGGSRRTRLGSEFFRSCQRIIPELTVRNARKWNTARALILPQYTRLYLLAEHRGSNGHAAVAVDDLQVLNC